MKSVYEKLEFNKIRDKLKSYMHSELALNYALNLKMLPKEELYNDLSELDEGMRFASKYKGISVYHIKNIMPDLASLIKEGVANIEFFATISLMLENISEIKKDYPKDEEFALINKYVSDLKNLESLRNRIDSVISKDLSIYDNASSHLASIRYQIKKEESSQPKIISSLMNKYRNYLNDERMALKNKGLALPIKVSYKNRVEGIVVDVSASGNTCFIMPLEILLSNNRIEVLKEQEQQEIIHILQDLAKAASQNVDDLRKNFFLLTHLDYLFGKVSYAFDIHGVIGKNDTFLNILEARHPLIAPEKVVANSFNFEEKKIMLITGPNAGGKTVALKTLGLLILMHQSGLALPCEEATIPYFENVYLDIGDDQSLDDNLSTFTSHMRALKNAILNVNDKSLVLIDELGSGTSPLDGEALAIGVIKHLHALSSYAVVSSHYDGLKSFALEQDYILNASMIFDEENLCPTYRIRLGVAGKSYGIEVASREGIPSSIIEDAKNYIKEKKSTSKEVLIDTLNQKLLQVDGLKSELENQKLELEKALKEQKKELDAIKLEKEKLEDNLEEEKKKLLLKAKEEVEEMMNEFKTKKDVKLHEVISLKKKIDDQIDNEEEVEVTESKEEFKVGDYVTYEENGLKGFIKGINKEQAQVKLDSGLTINIKLTSLKHVAQNKKVKRVITNDFVTSNISNKTVSLECNVIGLYVNEALQVVAKYLDDARACRFHRVRIVHGNGTGRLRQAIHMYLKKQSFIESFAFATYNEGGTGATVVYLK